MTALIIATLTLIVITAASLDMYIGSRRMTSLRSISPETEAATVWPNLSIIVAALDEENHISAALGSLAELDYDNLEIVAINDRSSDRTGELMEQFAATYHHVKVIHIKELPPGWLGKTHALHVGAQQAHGKLLLFTDADVSIEKSTLKRAVRRMEQEMLDHLCLLFTAELPGSLLNMVVIDFGLNLAAYLKPWQAANPHSPCSMGVGAFNLVRSKAYHAIGGHMAIAMHPIDDVALGKCLKQNGYRQECLFGSEFVRVPGYQSLTAMHRGLEKNTFAALDYSMIKVVGATCFVLGVSVWPYWAALLLTGPTRYINVAIIACHVVLFASAAQTAGIAKRHLLWMPVSPYVRLYTLWRAALRTLWQGGISWRGTFYSLTALKAHHIPLRGRRDGKRTDKT